MPRIASGIAALMLLVCTGAWAALDEAECADEVYAAIGRDLRIEDFADQARGKSSFIVSKACKPWPYKPELTLTERASKTKKNLSSPSSTRKTVSSTASNGKSGKTLRDWMKYSLGFDTARYQLAGDVRAFGLRFRSSAISTSCGGANWSDRLTLLVPNGKSLRPVLSLHRNLV
ncbi:MAG: hypothetical protein LBU11_00220 [Zoogloeaceae bacterium]|jgi:hypothetical protein|nr:hypothetical protein [Zoogloeaceae bacterium]